MKLRLLLLAVFATTVFAQSSPDSKPTATILKAARLLDVRKGAYLENAAVWIEGERIKEVGLATEIQAHAPKKASMIDLGPRHPSPRADRLPHPHHGAHP